MWASWAQGSGLALSHKQVAQGPCTKFSVWWSNEWTSRISWGPSFSSTELFWNRLSVKIFSYQCRMLLLLLSYMRIAETWGFPASAQSSPFLTLCETCILVWKVLSLLRWYFAPVFSSTLQTWLGSEKQEEGVCYPDRHQSRETQILSKSLLSEIELGLLVKSLFS